MSTKTVSVTLHAECTFEHSDVSPKDFALALAIAATDPRVQDFRIKPGDFVDVPVHGYEHLDNRPRAIRVHLATHLTTAKRPRPVAPLMPQPAWSDAP